AIGENQNHRARRCADAAGTDGEGHGRDRKSDRGVLARPLRVPVRRPRADCRIGAPGSPDLADRPRLQPLQARARTRRAAVRRAALRAGAREGVRPYIEKVSRQGEALFFYAIASRDLGDQAEYLRIVRRLVDEFPTQSWSEEALNNLATHYILQNEDENADVAFRELYEKFPAGRYAERAAWKLGWWAYKNGRPADAARVF